MVPISTAANKPGNAIRLDSGVIALTPNGKTAYVFDDVSGTVTVIRTATNTVTKVIRVAGPMKEDIPPPYIAITPNGKTVYVSDDYLGVVAIRTVTNTVGKTIHMEGDAIAITP